jgi:DNA polymerase III epsilon subunit-like protein
MKKTYLILDTETTGLVPEKEGKYISPKKTKYYNNTRLVELAWIIADEKNEIISKTSIRIKPNGFEIPAKATSIHGITTAEALLTGIHLTQALDMLHKDLLKIDETLECIVGHNIKFDLTVLMSEAHRIGNSSLYKLLKKPAYCTMKNTAKYLKIPSIYKMGEYKYPTLSELYVYLYKTNRSRLNNKVHFQRKLKLHSALGDTLRCFECFIKIKERYLI